MRIDEQTDRGVKLIGAFFQLLVAAALKTWKIHFLYLELKFIRNCKMQQRCD
jgi:hypothetical protein